MPILIDLKRNLNTFIWCCKWSNSRCCSFALIIWYFSNFSVELPSFSTILTSGVSPFALSLCISSESARCRSAYVYIFSAILINIFSCSSTYSGVLTVRIISLVMVKKRSLSLVSLVSFRVATKQIYWSNTSATCSKISCSLMPIPISYRACSSPIICST